MTLEEMSQNNRGCQNVGQLLALADAYAAQEAFEVSVSLAEGDYRTEPSLRPGRKTIRMTSRGRVLGTTAALWVAIAGAGALAAQPTQPFVESVDVQVVEVDVVVTDRKGRPVKGLNREDFELYVDGEPVEVANFYESAISAVEERTGRRNQTRTAVRSEARPGAADGGPLTVIFYLDDPNIYPTHRTRLLRRLETAVEPWRALEASFMLARFVNRLEVLVRPTRDLDAILAGAAAVPKGSPRAIQNGDGARRFAIKSVIDSYETCRMMAFCSPCVDNWGEMLSAARQYADNEATSAAIAVDGLADLVTTLAGVPGKKAVVHITDGLPQRPGISVLDYLGNELCRDLRPSAPSETMSEMTQYDESRRFNRIAAHANANRVTFYGLDAAGLRSASPDISLDNPRMGPSFQNVSLRAMNAQSGLHLLAQETGGKALTNANDLAILLDDVSKQFAASYSLGFIEDEQERDRVRQIRVLLAPGVAKGRRIEYRRTYRAKPLDERLAERLLSVAYLGAPENPLGANVELGGTTPLEKKVHELTVAVSVPADAIVTLPGKTGATGNASGEVRLWLVAVEDEKGARTTVRQKTVTVGGATGIPAVDGAYRVEVAMNLPEGGYQVAVGVRDETSGVMSLLTAASSGSASVREPVTVPNREAAN
ncbi:MAG: VWA domain-containing protein [Acidobacteria bacterium]|nr:VWA domain-containing protein [Acidobacteriota bacterium]